MRLTDKTPRYSIGHKFLEGKYKKCKCTISYSANKGFWYFYCSNENDTIRYNSLWDNIMYTTKESCHDDCVQYISNALKGGTNDSNR